MTNNHIATARKFLSKAAGISQDDSDAIDRCIDDAERWQAAQRVQTNGGQAVSVKYFDAEGKEIVL